MYVSQFSLPEFSVPMPVTWCALLPQVVVGANNKGAVKLVNSAFWGPTAQIAKVDGSGTVTFSQCHFDAWDTHHSHNGTIFHNGTAAIQQLGGTMIVTQSEFTQGGNPTHFLVGSNARKTIISENIVEGKLQLHNDGKGKLIVVNNADDS